MRGWHPCERHTRDHVLLGLACLADDVGLTREILECRPDLLNERCVTLGMIQYGGYDADAAFNGMPPLHAAISKRSWAVAEYLLSIPGINPDLALGKAPESWDPWPQSGDHRWTPLAQLVFFFCFRNPPMEVISEAPLKIARLLMDKGAAPLGPGGDGESPFSMLMATFAIPPERILQFDNLIKVVALFVTQFPRFSDQEVSEESPGWECLEKSLMCMHVMSNRGEGPSPFQLEAIRHRTGLCFERFDDLVLGWFFQSDLQLSVFRNFARLHCPAAFAVREKSRLESVLESTVCATSMAGRRL